MNTRFFMAACGLASLLGMAAHAQPAAAPAAPPTPQPLAFQSALQGYQPYTDDKIGNWKEANDNTGAIGGWRAYAKEAQQAGPSAAPGAAALPDPHAGHAKPQQEKP